MHPLNSEPQVRNNYTQYALAHATVRCFRYAHDPRAHTTQIEHIRNWKYPDVRQTVTVECAAAEAIYAYFELIAVESLRFASDSTERVNSVHTLWYWVTLKITSYAKARSTIRCILCMI